MKKIEWCLCQKKGIQLMDVKQHLSESYMHEADETLENVFSAKGKWKTITAYYACYSALYSIMMKCGIKSEIHECTIEMMELFDFKNEEKEFMADLKDDRIKAQYYLKNIVLKDENEVKKFIMRCRTVLSSLNDDDVRKIRDMISELKNKIC